MGRICSISTAWPLTRATMFGKGSGSGRPGSGVAAAAAGLVAPRAGGRSRPCSRRAAATAASQDPAFFMAPSDRLGAVPGRVKSVCEGLRRGTAPRAWITMLIDVLRAHAVRPAPQPARRAARGAARRRESASRPDAREPDAGRAARCGGPARAAGTGRGPALRAVALRPRRRALRRRLRLRAPRRLARPRPRAAPLQHQRSLRLPVQAAVRPRRRGADPAAGLSAVRVPGRARVGRRRAATRSRTTASGTSRWRRCAKHSPPARAPSSW